MNIKKHNARMIKFLCEKNGCNDRNQKIHFDRMVHFSWNPHPSVEFIKWWQTQPDFQENGIDSVRARNCKEYCDQYKEAVAVGLSDLPIDYPS